jgi:phosphoglycerate dehydrogenase-like enzyme
MTRLPERPVILFAHAAYQMKRRFEARSIGLESIEVTNRESLLARAGEADVIVTSGFWSNAILERAPRLRLVQSISAGVDQYDQAAFRRAGVRLASAQGVNADCAQNALRSLSTGG